MRVLITGHCGYIGPVMTRLLHPSGHEVVGSDTSCFRDLVEDLDAICVRDQEIAGDIRDISVKSFLY